MSENKEINPWKVLGTRSVYKNPWFSVREDQVIRPDGNPGTYSVVEPKVATGVVALDDDDHVWLVGQYRYPINLYSWEIIEGGAETGESAQSAAIRELKEEAGLVASDWTTLGPPAYLSNCFTSEQAVFFLAQGLAHVEAEPDGTEVLQLKRVPFNEVISQVRTGEISDAVSVIALERAWHYLKRI
jgi:8-oxo-dGTP pyrophosphatase MutT (NUDIX family)